MNKISLRSRWALWCALLVTGSGLIAVVVTLTFTSHLLRDRARQADNPAAPQTPPRSSAPNNGSGGGGDGVGPGSGNGPGPGSGGVDRSRARFDRDGTIAEGVIDDTRAIGIATVLSLAAVSLGIGWWVAGRMTRPITEVTRIASEVSGGRFGERIAHEGADEIGQLADTFNSMLDRLDLAFDAQRSFTADASHELRTPLTVMKAEIDVALDNTDADRDEYREALIGIRTENDRTIQLVEALLDLARSQSLNTVAYCELAEVARRAVSLHPADGRSMVVDLQPSGVNGDPILLDRLAANLVSNAERYTPVGGSIAVSTGEQRTAREQTQSFLTVDNDGELLTDDDVRLAFRRFDRRDADETTAGYGVGLSVVAAIAAAHGATIVAVPRPEGGLSITVRFAAAVSGAAHHQSNGVPNFPS